LDDLKDISMQSKYLLGCDILPNRSETVQYKEKFFNNGDAKFQSQSQSPRPLPPNYFVMFLNVVFELRFLNRLLM